MTTLFFIVVGFFFIVGLFSPPVTDRTAKNRPKIITKEFSRKYKEKVQTKKVTLNYNVGDMYMSAEDKATYLQSIEWKALKQRRLHIANYRCENCNSKDKLQLHHITYIRLAQENIEDMAILCGGPNGCHSKLHKIAATMYSNPYGRENEYPLSLLKDNHG